MSADHIDCQTCANLSGKHCVAYKQLGAAPGYQPVVQPRRCPVYVPLPDNPDQRKGMERWPWLVLVVPLDARKPTESFKTWRFEQEWKPEHDRDAYGRKLEPGT